LEKTTGACHLIGEIGIKRNGRAWKGGKGMTQMMLILALAVTVEGLVQYAKCIIDMIVKKEYKTTITQLAALVVSIVLCLLAGADIYATFGITFIGGWGGKKIWGCAHGIFFPALHRVISHTARRFRPSRNVRL